jgi:BirA family biotin operon repressor/biotin-[acetyl-CoA-carboxylase] ligase
MARGETAVPLNAARLQADLVGGLIGRRVVVLDQTTSTNDALLDLAKDDPGPGLVVFAEEQTAGRGQRGNQWESRAYQGLWFSFLLWPAIPLSESPRLTSWAAAAIAEAIIQKCNLPAVVKPPNDIYVARRKIAGVLVEMRAQPAAAHVAVVGIGINVNQAAEDFPVDLRERATSLAMSGSKMIDRHALAVALLRRLDQTYADLAASFASTRSGE